MILYEGIYFPDFMEDRIEHNYQLFNRQYGSTCKLAVDYFTPNKRVALDIGANVGIFTKKLAEEFDEVHSFEPLEENLECLLANTEDLDNVIVHHHALGNETKTTGMVPWEGDPFNSGGFYVCGKGDVSIKKLDDLGLSCVDFMKIDVEGYEYFVLKGGKDLITNNRTTIMLEDKPSRLSLFGLPENCVSKLLTKEFKQKQVARVHSDYIYAYKGSW